MLLKAVTAGLVGALATLIVCAVFPAIHAGIGLWTTVGAGSLLSFVIEILTALARKVTRASARGESDREG